MSNDAPQACAHPVVRMGASSWSCQDCGAVVGRKPHDQGPHAEATEARQRMTEASNNFAGEP